MSKNKRMVYIWDENVSYYDSLENKSDFVNRQIAAAVEAGMSEQDFRDKQSAWGVDQNAQPKLEGIDDPSHPEWHPDPRIRETRKRLAEMDERDSDNVRRSRSGN